MRQQNRFSKVHHWVLLALGVSPELVTREQQEMKEVAFATTTNRSVIGSMNQLGMFPSYELECTSDLLSLALRLSHIPMTALKGKGANTHPFPDIVTGRRQGGHERCRHDRGA